MRVLLSSVCQVPHLASSRAADLLIPIIFIDCCHHCQCLHWSTNDVTLISKSPSCGLSFIPQVSVIPAEGTSHFLDQGKERNTQSSALGKQRKCTKLQSPLTTLLLMILGQDSDSWHGPVLGGFLNAGCWTNMASVGIHPAHWP